MRIIFAGTPDFAAAHLSHLIENQNSLSELLEIVAVYTQPDRRAGRGKKLLPPPVKKIGLDNNLPVFQPSTLKTQEEQDQLKKLDADIMIVAAYGMLLPKAVLDIPYSGCINVHASLLPRWRGAAPIERAIAAGDQESGVTIMQMDVGLDTGDMLLKRSCDITNNETGDSLLEKLVNCGKAALLESLELIINKQTKPEKQDDALSCYAPKLKKEEGQINWQEPAEQLERNIRAFTSSLASFSILNGERLRFVEVMLETNNANYRDKLPGEIIALSKDTLYIACGINPSFNPDASRENSSEKNSDNTSCGILLVKKIQLPGKKVLSIAEILNGKPDLFKVGMQFEMPAVEHGAC